MNTSGCIALGLILLVLAPEGNAGPDAKLWAYWSEEISVATQGDVDHAPWQQLLQKHIETSGDGVNRVAYASFTDSDRSELANYIRSLAEQDPRALPVASQMSYWINLYNALTVQVVLEHPKKAGILRMGGWFSIGPWNEALLMVSGKRLTLNDIEHRILRPIFKDHRVHYALNCASLGCPNLRREAYTAENLQQLLDAGEHEYINHPRGISFDDRGNLRLSRIFDWYQKDFSADEAGLLEYLAKNHTRDGERLRNYRGRIDYAYDWSLNSKLPR